MSKTQDKRKERELERDRFILARRMQQVAMFKQAYEVGNKLYEDNKEKLSAEESAQLEKMREEQLAALSKLEAEINELADKLDEANPNPQA